jgi:hypothetical protein
MVTIETTLCEADRILLQEVKDNQLKILQLLTTGNPETNWLKGPEVAKKLHVDRKTLFNWRSRGILIYDPQKRRYREDSVIQRAKDLHLKVAS